MSDKRITDLMISDLLGFESEGELVFEVQAKDGSTISGAARPCKLNGVKQRFSASMMESLISALWGPSSQVFHYESKYESIRDLAGEIVINTKKRRPGRPRGTRCYTKDQFVREYDRVVALLMGEEPQPTNKQIAEKMLISEALYYIYRKEYMM